MAIGIGGPSAFRSAGTYAAASTYRINDVVTYSGGSYVATTGTTGNTPTNTAYWQPLGAAGRSAPTGGSTGAVLTKNSSTDNDVIWISPTVAVSTASPYLSSVMQSGLWYDNRLTGSTATTNILQTNRGQYYALYLAQDTAINALGVYNANSVAGTLTAAVLTANATTGLPGTLLSSTAIALTASNGAFSNTVTTVTVPAGLNYLACFGPTTIGIIGTSSDVERPIQGSATFSTTIATSSQLNCYQGNSGVAIASDPTVSASNTGGNATIFFKVA